MIYMFLAPGFEETEAVAALDVMRRAKLSVTTVGVGGKTVAGAHDIAVGCDISDGEFRPDDLEMLVLPGGQPGVDNLGKSAAVRRAIDYAVSGGHWLCAICAAPSIYGELGLLKGKRYTCYPGFEKGIDGIHCADRLVRDGKLITAKGPGVALLFGLEIVEVLCGKERRDQIERDLQ